MSLFRLMVDHLWQSTLFAGVIVLVAATMRRKRAGVRHLLWLAASIKFVVPFAALGAIGAAIGSRAALRVPPPAPTVLADLTRAPFVVETAQRPAAAAAGAVVAHAAIGLPLLLLAMWAVGGAIVLARWGVRWIRTARVVRAAAVADTGREAAILRRVEDALRRGGPSGPPSIAVRLSDATIEPGVFGVWRPVLVWPLAMSAQLSDDQIEAIVVHELSHIRRRDNLTAAMHAFVQALCWFHPVVWWIGARLADERERACDEAVVRAGRDRQVYAESLLKTCQFCVGAPETSMAGVTGSDLKHRVSNIMTAPPGARLGAAARVVFVMAVVAVLAVPVINGAAGVPQVTPGLSLPDPGKVFDAASVRQNTSGARSGGSSFGKGNFRVENMALKLVLLSAFPIQEGQLVGGPDWLATDRFDMLGKAAAATSDADLKVMIQNLLIDRLSMKLHIETRNLPIYALVRARTDGQIGPDMHVLPPMPADSPANNVMMGRGPGAMVGGVGAGPAPSTGGGRSVFRIDDGGPASAGQASSGPGASMMHGGMRMADLARMLSGLVKRSVVDRTGLDGRFDITLRYTMPGSTTGAADPAQSAPELFTALQEQLGLKLEATRGPVEVLVIDSAAHPKNDDFEMPQ